MKQHAFSAEIKIIGVNPYVLLPEDILLELFKAFGKDRGPIPVKGKINGKAFSQTVVKFQGVYRLYVNGIMMKASGVQVGDKAEFVIEVDTTSREIPMHPEFAKALQKNKKAEEAFARYPASRQKEINRYLNNIKSEEIRAKNIDKIIRHLKGEKVEYFVLLGNKRESICYTISMQQETIQTLHPTIGKRNMKISLAKYEQVKAAMLSVLKTQKLTHTELFRELEKKLAGKFEGNISWYGETVKLDLEARKIIFRTNDRPQKYFLGVR